VLAINDFHGNIEPPTGSSGRIQTGVNADGTAINVDAGGSAYLATHLKMLAQGQEHTTFVGSGDLIGASPLTSGLFHDEPTIKSLSAMGMRFAGVGNHEFDEGSAELARMQYGGCHPTDGCSDGPFLGAAFDYLAANVRLAGRSQTLFRPYEVQRVGSVPVAYIGLTLKGTPDIVTPEGVAGLQFDDEVQTVNRIVRELRESAGVHAFVILIHQGGQQNGPYAKGFQDVNGCENVSGDIFPIADALDDDVDVVASAHTHQAYNCTRDGKLVTSAAAFGRLVTKVDLTLDPTTDDVKDKSAQNVVVTRDVTPDPDQQALVTRYQALAKTTAQRVVGSITATIPNRSNAVGESPLGDVIADAQLAATQADEQRAVVAFMNPGGIRADLIASAGNGQVTYNDAYTVQPFANTLVVKTLTGAQIKALLEQQFPATGGNKVLQVSRGFTYSYDLTKPQGGRIDPASIKLGETTIDPAASYRVAMNSFLATGGDGFTVFNQGTAQVGGAVDLDALNAYLGANSPVAPGPQDRITGTLPAGSARAMSDRLPDHLGDVPGQPGS
jgi:5'-nucleotidase